MKQYPEGESRVSVSTGITELNTFEDLGRARYGWEKWGCGLRLLRELRRHLKETRWRLSTEWVDETVTSTKVKTSCTFEG